MTKTRTHPAVSLLIAAVLTVMWIVLAIATFKAANIMGADQAGDVFFGDMSHPWRAQFNIDLGWHLILAATWVFLRARNAALGAFWAVLAIFCGGLFTLAYAAIVIVQEGGDLYDILLGRQARSQRT